MGLFLLSTCREISPNSSTVKRTSPSEKKKSLTADTSRVNDPANGGVLSDHVGVEFYNSDDDYIDNTGDTVEFVRREDNEHAIS